MAAFLPVNIWLSHFAKPDVGLAFAVLLLAWSLLRKLETPEAKGVDVLIGVAVAIAVSFKQTSVFVVTPALVGLVVLLRWDSKVPWSRIARGLLVSLATCGLLCIPMNLGILLNIKGYLEGLHLIALVMRREATASQIAEHIVPILAGNVTGLTAAGLIVFLFAPLVRRDPKFLMLWGTSVLAYAGIIVASGGVRIVPRYFLPYDQLAFTLGCIAVLSLCERKGLSRLVGVSLAVAILPGLGLGSVEVVRQALTLPMGARCSEVIRAIANPERDKILAGDLAQVGVPIIAAAANANYDREERLAKKYGVKLPERPEERSSRRKEVPYGYYVRAIPFSRASMQLLAPDVAVKMVRPYHWPIQDEEWNLDYWTTRGFNIFVLRDEGTGFITRIPSYQSLYQQIKENCELVKVLANQRDLFYESELRIYRLRDRHE
jgi:hypothetical protein